MDCNDWSNSPASDMTRAVTSGSATGPNWRMTSAATRDPPRVP